VRCALVSKQCKVVVLVQSLLGGGGARCGGVQSIEKTSVCSSASQANRVMTWTRQPDTEISLKTP
jgi:hypothetical protein